VDEIVSLNIPDEEIAWLRQPPFMIPYPVFKAEPFFKLDPSAVVDSRSKAAKLLLMNWCSGDPSENF